MIISHVKIFALQTIINHSFGIFYIGRKDSSLYNKQKNTRVLGNTRIISRVISLAPMYYLSVCSFYELSSDKIFLKKNELESSLFLTI